MEQEHIKEEMEGKVTEVKRLTQGGTIIIKIMK